MSTAVAPERVKQAPPAPSAKPAAAKPPAAPAAPEAEPPSNAWAGDRIALAVWMIAALIIGFLLVKDVVYAVLLGHA
jgi:hypothetical protein